MTTHRKKLIVLSALMLAILTSFAEKKGEQHLSEEEMLTEWNKMRKSKTSSLSKFNNDKFGMFIHWGLYAIPGGTWKGKTIEEHQKLTLKETGYRSPRVAEWIQRTARIPRAEYAQLANQFNPTYFDADKIARLAKAAGMKYLVITSKHHDGFAMYHSKVNKYNVVDATPYKRDVVKELETACKKYGLDFGLYYSQNLDWADASNTHYKKLKEKDPKTSNFGVNFWDPSDNTYEEYLENKAFPQIKEILSNYDIKQLWYDTPKRLTKELSFSFYKAAHQHSPNTIVNDRVGNEFGDFGIPGDNKIPSDPDSYNKPWQTVGTLNNSWGYKSYDQDWKSVKELVFWLVEIVSKGGNYMLNIGPDGTGKVPEQCVTNLEYLGKWIDINGEAIYGTSKRTITKEGSTKVAVEGTGKREEFKNAVNNFKADDIWFTQKENNIYAIAIEYPSDNVVKVKSLANENITSVSLLGSNKKVTFTKKGDYIEVKLPERVSDYGYVLKFKK